MEVSGFPTASAGKQLLRRFGHDGSSDGTDWCSPDTFLEWYKQTYIETSVIYPGLAYQPPDTPVDQWFKDTVMELRVRAYDNIQDGHNYDHSAPGQSFDRGTENEIFNGDGRVLWFRSAVQNEVGPAVALFPSCTVSPSLLHQLKRSSSSPVARPYLPSLARPR